MNCCGPGSVEVAAPQQEPAQMAPLAPAVDPEFTLAPHATIPKAEGPVLVVILDGFGENEFKGA